MRNRASIDAILEQFYDTVGDMRYISPTKFMSAMDLDIGSFAANAEVTAEVVANTPHSEAVQAHLRTILRVLRAALEIHGNLPAAISWFRHRPLLTFEGNTSEELVAKRRTDDLIRMVQTYEGGFADSAADAGTRVGSKSRPSTVLSDSRR